MWNSAAAVNIGEYSPVVIGLAVYISTLLEIRKRRIKSPDVHGPEEKR